jgi:hypothetical protein
MDINFEPFVEWDNSDHCIERFLSKAQKTALTLCLLTTQHLVPRLHCNLVACQQQAHATSRIKKEDIYGYQL